MGAWVSRPNSFSIRNNYITELMSVLQGSRKRRQSVQRPESANQASPARIPWFDVATLDLFVRRLTRNAARTSGPSVRRVRLWSSPVRSLTTQVQTRADVTPNPIADNAGCRIPLADLVLLKLPIHAGTSDISYRFPAALPCPWISS